MLNFYRGFIKKTYSFRLVFALALLLMGLGVYFWARPKTCNKLECLEMDELGQFKEEEVYQDDGRVYRALWSKDNKWIRVEVRSDFSEREGRQEIRANVVRIKALFENAVSPYPGEISDELSCGEDFKPVYQTIEFNDLRVDYFSGFLNERLVFGACTDSDASYWGALIMFYCPQQRQLFQLEIITPRDNFVTSPPQYQRIIQSISCVDPT